MKIKKYTRKSHQFNEDRYLVHKDVIMVMDGATALEKSSLKPTSGSFLVNKIKKDLPKEKGTIIERLDSISKKLYKMLEKSNTVSEKILPSCGLSWVEFDNEYVIIHTIGDCEAFIAKKDGSTKRIIINDLIELDNKSISELIKISKEQKISVKNARSKIDNILIKHRLMMNKNDGYSIFTPSSNPNFEYSTHVFKKDEIKDIYLYSDGFADAFTTFKLYQSAEDLFSKNRNLAKVIEKIVKKANQDKEYNKYPRFKMIDDITIVKITF